MWRKTVLAVCMLLVALLGMATPAQATPPYPPNQSVQLVRDGTVTSCKRVHSLTERVCVSVSADWRGWLTKARVFVPGGAGLVTSLEYVYVDLDSWQSDVMASFSNETIPKVNGKVSETRTYRNTPFITDGNVHVSVSVALYRLPDDFKRWSFVM